VGTEDSRKPLLEDPRFSLHKGLLNLEMDTRDKAYVMFVSRHQEARLSNRVMESQFERDPCISALGVGQSLKTLF
jgi:hypothetical protein